MQYTEKENMNFYFRFGTLEDAIFKRMSALQNAQAQDFQSQQVKRHSRTKIRKIKETATCPISRGADGPSRQGA